MLATRILALLLATTFLLAAPAPVSASEACAAAVESVESAIDARPGELTPEVVEAVARAVEACGYETAVGVAGGERIGTTIACRPGTLQGAGLMEVVISIPPLQSFWYEEIASETYTLDGSGNQLFTARGGSTLGFDAVTDAVGNSWGTVYYAGNAASATSASVNGSCERQNRSPCAGSGHAELLGGAIEIWMLGHLGICEDERRVGRVKGYVDGV